MLPQVLAGLGVLSALSAGCLFWLQRLQPVFFAAALGGLAYQVYLVRQRPPQLRPPAVKAILAASFALNALVMGAWVVLWFRYR